jgi:hypothetical protein
MNLDSHRHPRRLAAWLLFVLALTALAYAGRLLGGDAGDGGRDIAYRYSSSVAALVQYLVMLGILLLIGRGLPRRELFALRSPASWRRAVGLAGLGLGVIWLSALVYQGVLSLVGDWSPTDEQGLVPEGWDSSRAGAFVAFFLTVTIVAPIVEELTFRGMGVSLVLPYGIALAVLTTGLLFGAVHGLVVAFPVLAVFGVVVGWLRVRTDSVYPSVLLHATFNGVALIVSVSVAA